MKLSGVVMERVELHRSFRRAFERSLNSSYSMSDYAQEHGLTAVNWAIGPSTHGRSKVSGLVDAGLSSGETREAIDSWRRHLCLDDAPEDTAPGTVCWHGISESGFVEIEVWGVVDRDEFEAAAGIVRACLDIEQGKHASP